MIIQKKKIKGKIVFKRSEWSKDKCQCCDSHRHIFCNYIDFEENYGDEIRDMLKELYKGNKNEGREVEMVIQVKLRDAKEDKKVIGERNEK